MWSLLVITSIIFQSAVAIFLLNGVRTDDDIHKHLRAMLIILLVHLSAKFLLLAVLKNLFLYARLPTGFSLAYGPLLLVIARSILGRPLRPQNILLHFIPFLLFSLVYVFLVIAGAIGVVARPEIIGYVAWYQWLDLASLFGYPIYVKVLLRGSQTKKTQLVRQIANILLLGITAGLGVFILEHKMKPIPGFDMRLIPYMCFAAIPVFILRYRLQASAAAPGSAVATGAVPGMAIAATGTAAAMSSAVVLPQELAAPLAVPPVSEVTLSAEEARVPEEALIIEVVPAAEAPAAEAAQLVAADRRYEKSGLDAGKMDEYEATLATFMRKSKIYLDADLSLEGLASKMKMSKHHLTQLLNERIMKNFYSYINEYRIAEATDRLNNPVLQVNILSLAFDCGFNSRSSFNSYFKKITGYTPSAYRKIQLEKPAARPGSGVRQTSVNRSAIGRNSAGRRSSGIIRDTSPSA